MRRCASDEPERPFEEEEEGEEIDDGGGGEILEVGMDGRGEGGHIYVQIHVRGHLDTAPKRDKRREWKKRT